MGLVLIGLIALAWVAFLLPPYLRSRRETNPHGSIGSFRDQLSTLSALERARVRSSAGPSGSIPPFRGAGSPARLAAGGPSGYRPGLPSRSEVRKRRKDIFLTLGVLAAMSLLLAVFFGGIMWAAALVLTGIFAAYVALLVRIARVSAEQQMKVRRLPSSLPAARPAAESGMLLRRTASR